MQFNYTGHEAGIFSGTCLQWRRVMFRDAFCADDDVFILLHLDENTDDVCWDTSSYLDHPSEFGTNEIGQIRNGKKGIIVVDWHGATKYAGTAFFRFKPSWAGDDGHKHFLLEGRAIITKEENGELKFKCGTVSISANVDITADNWHSIGFSWESYMEWWEVGVTCLEHDGNVAPETASSTTIVSGDPWTVSFKANAAALVDMTGYDAETGRMAILYRVSGPHNGIFDGSVYHDNDLIATGAHCYSVTSDGSQITCYRDGVQVGSPFNSVVGLDDICKWGSDYQNNYDWTENLIYTSIHDDELTLAQVIQLHDQMNDDGRNVLSFDGVIVGESATGSYLEDTDFTGYVDVASVYDECIGFRKVLTDDELIGLHEIYLSGSYISPIYKVGNELPIDINWLGIEPAGYEIDTVNGGTKTIEMRGSWSAPSETEIEPDIWAADATWTSASEWFTVSGSDIANHKYSFLQFRATFRKL